MTEQLLTGTVSINTNKQTKQTIYDLEQTIRKIKYTPVYYSNTSGVQVGVNLIHERDSLCFPHDGSGLVDVLLSDQKFLSLITLNEISFIFFSLSDWCLLLLGAVA